MVRYPPIIESAAIRKALSDPTRCWARVGMDG
jgi:hypothetical protein